MAEQQTLSSAIERWRDDLDTYYEEIKKFQQTPIKQVMKQIAAYAAWASHIRLKLMRLQSSSAAKSFRLSEIDPFLEMLDFQFKIWSRLASVLQTEWEMNNK